MNLDEIKKLSDSELLNKFEAYLIDYPSIENVWNQIGILEKFVLIKGFAGFVEKLEGVTMTDKTETREAKLRGCPFCGELPEITKHFKEEMWNLLHRCKVMGALKIDWNDKEYLIETWNTRSGASGDEAKGWIPINSDDDLPKENTVEFFVTTDLGFVDIALWSDGEFWIDKKIYTQDIIAYRPLPSPYVEQK